MASQQVYPELVLQEIIVAITLTWFSMMENRVKVKPSQGQEKARWAEENQQETSPNHISPAEGLGALRAPIYGLGLFLVDCPWPIGLFLDLNSV